MYLYGCVAPGEKFEKYINYIFTRVKSISYIKSDNAFLSTDNKMTYCGQEQ